MKELATPIRMYWDLGAGIDHARIADEIAANKLLSLQITLQKGLTDACRSVLERLKDKPLAVSLVLPFAAWSQDTLALVQTYPVRQLLISTSNPRELELILPIKKQVTGKPAFGIAFHVTRQNFPDLPQVLQFCIDRQIQHLVLPMQRLAGDEEAFTFSSKERKELTSELNKIQRPSSLKITIHDPFLWRAFFPSVEFPDGGCQAANTMLIISSNGDVYPCPSMPIRIGNVTQSTLNDIFSSDLKKEVRKNILYAPADCSGCEELRICKGGCRGRAYAMKNSFTANDPACR